MPAKLKAMKDPAELAAVPIDEPVLVDLGFSGGSERPEERAEEPQQRADEPAPNEAIARLTRDYEALKEQQKATEQRLRDEAETRAKVERELAQSRSYAASTESTAVDNGLSASMHAAESAKAAFKAAFEAGDAAALAEAQERLGRASADVREFERAKTSLKDRSTAEPARPAAPSQTDINAHIDSNPQLLPQERTWLKAHPETLVDKIRQTELDAAYYKAMRKGIARGSDAYFQFLDQELGYSQPNNNDDGETNMPPVAAPVTRSATPSTGGPPRTQVRLTSEQREMAQMMGLTDVEYAAGVLQMENEKRANPEKYARR